MADPTFHDEEPEANHWCSRQDCVDVYHALPNYVDLDVTELNRNIVRATTWTQTTLRERWSTWPFAIPPEDIRVAVATIAVYRCYAGRALPDELDWLREEVAEARQFIRDLAAGKGRLASESTSVAEMQITDKPDWSERDIGFEHATGDS